MSPQVQPLFACVYSPPAPVGPDNVSSVTVEQIAQQFSPRYERHHERLVSIDVSGLERMLGRSRTIGEELRRHAATCGIRVHVAVAGTRMAALVLAHANPGLTIVDPGHEAGALAAVPISILDRVAGFAAADPSVRGDSDASPAALAAVAAFKQWGLKTLGELAALPAADLTARLGKPALVWQAIARGDDLRPLIPTLEEERFEASLDLEWPIDGLEPLSFVLTRLLEPLSTRLERRDRGTAVLHVILRLVTREPYVRRLELPAPMRDVRTLRTLTLLDLESHPPGAAIDRVTIVIDPTPGRILQHTLFTRAQPTPEQLSTLIARLGALIGQDRVGAAAMVDSYRPGAFAMVPFAADRDQRGARRDRREDDQKTSVGSADSAGSANSASSALRRCRQPVPARVAVAGGRPVRVTTDRRGFAGGSVVACAGPWRSSGNWWIEGAGGAGRAGEADRAGRAGASGGAGEAVVVDEHIHLPHLPRWDRDEWDVALNDGAVYRVFQDRGSGAWFVDAIVD